MIIKGQHEGHLCAEEIILYFGCGGGHMNLHMDKIA